MAQFQGPFVTFYRLHQPSKLLALTTGVSLLVHVLLWLLLQGADFSFLEPSAPTPTVELVLADEPAAATAPPAATPPEQADPAPPDAAASDQPRDITLTPERLATAPPDRADYLSDVDSRAADLIPGGTAGAQPGARNDADHQSVAIVEEQLGGEGVVAVEEPVFEPEAARPPAEQPPATAPGSETSPQGDMPTAEIEERREQPAEEAAEAGAETEPREASDYEDWVSEQRAASLLGSGDRGFEFDQSEYGDVETNVDIVGGYRLNTYAWNFAPWIRRFANDLQRAWIPPYAYRLGIIDGRTEVRVVIEPDGTPSRMDVLAREGHESLHTASVNALRACAPYRPLPPDFPKPQLVIVFTLIYPELRR